MFFLADIQAMIYTEHHREFMPLSLLLRPQCFIESACSRAPIFFERVELRTIQPAKMALRFGRRNLPLVEQPALVRFCRRVADPERVSCLTEAKAAL